MTKKDFDDNRGIWVNLFGVDNQTLDALYADIVKRNVSFDKRLLLTVKPWFVWLVSLYERFVTPNNHLNFDCSGDDFVFVSCPDPVHRVKTLPLIAGDLKYTKFFLPTTTRPTVVKRYYKYYKNETSEKVFFGVFSFSDIRNYIRFIKKNKEILNSIKCNTKEDTIAMKYHVMRYALYNIYAKRVFSKIDRTCIWLFEHDKFYFIPIIEQFKKVKVMTAQLQHGTFFNPNIDVFIPLYTEKILCCSKREEKLYLDGDVNREDIYVVGAPLQTLGAQQIDDIDIKYDILVILTAVSIAFSSMSVVLKYLKEHYIDKRILLRFRPRSRDTDMLMLSEYVEVFKVSKGTSLMQDILSSQKVISFSDDAIFEVLMARKKIVNFVEPYCLYRNFLDGICYTVDNIEECMSTLMNSNDEMDNEKYVDAYGETDVNKISQNFNTIITHLKECNYEN